MNIAIPEAYPPMRAALPFDSVSFGYTTIHLHPFSALGEAQEGYGVVPEGDETDWEPSWVVIGYEDNTGDPIFIDTEDNDLPVYTAAHGMGEWTPRLIAFSFRHFVNILEQVRGVARGRETPIALERNPLSDIERDEALSFIRRNNPDVDMTFWEVLLRPPE